MLKIMGQHGLGMVVLFLGVGGNFANKCNAYYIDLSGSICIYPCSFKLLSLVFVFPPFGK